MRSPNNLLKTWHLALGVATCDLPLSCRYAKSCAWHGHALFIKRTRVLWTLTDTLDNLYAVPVACRLWAGARIWGPGGLATPEAGGCLRAPPHKTHNINKERMATRRPLCSGVPGGR